MHNMMASLLPAAAFIGLLLSPGVAEAQISGSVRLVGRNGVTSSSLTAGRLEVYYNEQWGTVCDDSFGASEATTACTQLGFSNYIEYSNVDSAFDGYRFEAASSSTPIWLDNLFCSSSDTTLSQCTHNGIGVEDCDHSEDVYVSCLGNGAIRLHDQGTFFTSESSAGRLEIYWNGVWGTVCENSFGETDANVACRQLGYSSAVTHGNAFTLGYTRGSGTIWLDNLACTSSDSMLSSCTHNGFGNEDCSHSQDVAVSCSTTSTDISDFVTGIATTIIAGIVIAVVVPILCIIVCVVIICIAVCTGACCAAGASNRNNRRNVGVVAQSNPTTTVVTTATAQAQAQAPLPPPSYTDVQNSPYPAQPQAAPAPYPTQGQAYPQAYPPQEYPLQEYPSQEYPQGYPPQGQDYPQAQYPPQQQQSAPYPAYPAAGDVPPQAYPDEKQQLEMQQYPGSDPAYPPPGTVPYPDAGDPNYPPPN